MVRSFERAHEHQSHLWRGVFAAFILCYVGFLLYSIAQQALNPWELRYHAYFMEDVESWMIIFADVVAIFACLFTLKGLLHRASSHVKLLWCSCGIGLLLAAFWLYHMLRLPKFHWDIIWLAAGPLSGSCICLYVDHLFAESLGDIRKLRSCMYEYKVK